MGRVLLVTQNTADKDLSYIADDRCFTGRFVRVTTVIAHNGDYVHIAW